jgi:hypothetical protein
MHGLGTLKRILGKPPTPTEDEESRGPPIKRVCELGNNCLLLAKVCSIRQAVAPISLRHGVHH